MNRRYRLPPWLRPPSLRRIVAMTRKELLHLVRDPRMFLVVLVAPVVQLSVLGLTANFDVVDVPVVVVDQDRTPLSRGLAARLDAGQAFEIRQVTDSFTRAEEAMDRSEAEVAVILPRGTARQLARGEGADIPVWVDGTDTNRALMAQQYVEAILTRAAAERTGSSMDRLPVGFTEPRARVLFNPALKSRWFMVPGVLVMVLTVITVLLAALAVVKERENGTIEQLSVTPIRPVELIVGKLAPFVIVGVIDGALVTVVAIWGFKVPFLGSVLHLAGMVALYLVSSLGIGLLISTVSNTQQQAMMSTIMVLLPSLLLGGVMYPVSNMPTWAQRLSDLLPIRYFITMVRGVFLKGIGFETLTREAAILAALGVLLLGVAVFRFRKRSA